MPPVSPFGEGATTGQGRRSCDASREHGRGLPGRAHLADRRPARAFHDTPNATAPGTAGCACRGAGRRRPRLAHGRGYGRRGGSRHTAAKDPAGGGPRARR